MDAQLRRRNAILGITLGIFGCTLALSVFVWRYAHHQTAIPQGGTYAATYQIHP